MAKTTVGGLKSKVKMATAGAAAALRRRDPSDAVVISCEPRGGSTWLTEAILTEPGSAQIWEPLHKRWVPEVEALEFSWRQYIPVGADWPEARHLLEKILTGRVTNEWILQATPLKQFMAADRLVVKFCRANALLPWLSREFNFKRKPIHLLRHPFAVATSQDRMGNFSTRDLIHTHARRHYPEHLEPHAAYVATLETVEEQAVASWCLSNLPSLRDPEAGTRWITVYYEDLTLNPEEGLTQIFGAWGEAAPEAALEQARKPSRMTQGDALRSDPAEQVSKWRTAIAPDLISRMTAVLEHFGVTEYGDEPLPRKG